tara:strand:+ start:14150 stop:14491 length:342 start_codon:yes stop_codon:yes gene_type:complete
MSQKKVKLKDADRVDRTYGYTNWNQCAKIVLEGKKIVKVEYIEPREADKYGWYNRGVSFILEDNTRIIVMQDDEGNGPGTLAYLNDGVDALLPVLDLDYEDRYLNKKKGEING